MQEPKIYLADFKGIKYPISTKELAQEQGNVYTLEQFRDLFNKGNLTLHNLLDDIDCTILMDIDI